MGEGGDGGDGGDEGGFEAGAAAVAGDAAFAGGDLGGLAMGTGQSLGGIDPAGVFGGDTSGTGGTGPGAGGMPGTGVGGIGSDSNAGGISANATTGSNYGGGFNSDTPASLRMGQPQLAAVTVIPMLVLAAKTLASAWVMVVVSTVALVHWRVLLSWLALTPCAGTDSNVTGYESEFGNYPGTSPGPMGGWGDDTSTGTTGVSIGGFSPGVPGVSGNNVSGTFGTFGVGIGGINSAISPNASLTTPSGVQTDDQSLSGIPSVNGVGAFGNLAGIAEIGGLPGDFGAPAPSGSSQVAGTGAFGINSGALTAPAGMVGGLPAEPSVEINESTTAPNSMDVAALSAPTVSGGNPAPSEPPGTVGSFSTATSQNGDDGTAPGTPSSSGVSVGAAAASGGGMAGGWGSQDANYGGGLSSIGGGAVGNGFGGFGANSGAPEPTAAQLNTMFDLSEAAKNDKSNPVTQFALGPWASFMPTKNNPFWTFG